MHFDVVIIGAGIAGLFTSLEISKNLKVLVLSKDEPWECNTFYAQGGVATPKDKSDIDSHIEDTLKAGAGLCDKKSVEYLSKNALSNIQKLIDLGVAFDRESDGSLMFTKEGAHSTSRILHARGDGTGRILHQFLIEKNPHTLFKNAVVHDILLEDGECYGVSVTTKRGNFNIYAKCVVIASGGVGSIFECHTNSRSISGEMQGLAYEKGLKLRDMEMMQFHPTVYVKNTWARKLLLSEALRGEGAHIVDEEGKRFLFHYDSRGELAPRDIISRAIFDYKEKSKNEVYLSFKPFSNSFFKDRFPNIYRNLTTIGFSLPDDIVPISPAFHYSMGGIECEVDGRVLGVKNLFVVGEAASNRVHGANRLASNSLLEGIVFGKRVALEIENSDLSFKIKEFKQNREILYKPKDKILKRELRELMWREVGVIRRASSLPSALERVEDMLKEDIGRMFRLRAFCAREIIRGAISRKESIGAHYII